MTEREAFEAWLSRRYPLADATDADDAFEAAMSECWLAACAWQRDQILAMLPGGYSVDPQWLADEIRAQGER